MVECLTRARGVKGSIIFQRGRESPSLDPSMYQKQVQLLCKLFHFVNHSGLLLDILLFKRVPAFFSIPLYVSFLIYAGLQADHLLPEASTETPIR